jgi:dihydrolipoamide dehydrogenase
MVRAMSSNNVDVIVIGSGPGGYVCGIRLGQLGLKAVVVERESAGGVCLNVGCIPSKALIHAAKSYEKIGKASDMGISVPGAATIDARKLQEWKGGIVKKLTSGVKSLLKANKAEFVAGKARLDGKGSYGHKVVVEQGGTSTTYEAKSVVIATGSRPFEIPGFKVDQKRIVDSSGALALDQVPRRMVVIGGGYIGLELGTVYAKLGSKVTVVEAMDSVLAGMDKDCVKVIAGKLGKMGVEVLLGAKAKGWEDKKDRAVVKVDHKGQEVSIDTDVVLVSVGRRPNSEDLGLDRAGVKLDGKGFVVADAQLKTNVPGIFAIGDVIGGMMLAHKASKEAVVVAEIIAGHHAAMDVRTIPAVVFTDPEMASSGMTEEQARAAGHELKVGKFPFAVLGRAMSVGDTEGFAKIIGDAKTGEVLGLHIVGNGASDLISEGALAIEMGAVLEDLMLTVHPHPTLSEAIMEAAAAALGEAIHIQNR